MSNCRKCGGNSWVRRDNKPACINCLAHARVRRETVCGDHLIPISDCGCEL